MTPLVFDIETDGDPWTGRLLCVGWQYEDTLRVDAGPEVRPDLLALLADPTIPKVTHTKYDARWLRMHGIDVVGPFYDTQVMAYRLNENTPLTLEYCVKRYVHREMDKRIRTSAGQPVFRCDDGRVVPLGEAPLDEVMKYNAEDVDSTVALFNKLWSRLEESMWLDHFLTEDVPFTEVLLDMECSGLPVDLVASETFREQLELEAEQAKLQLLEDSGLPDTFNLNSGPQLSAYLFHKTFELADAIACEPGQFNGYTRDQAEQKLVDAQTFVDTQVGGFTVGKVGRSYLHGVWTLRGRGLPPGIPTPSGDRPSTSSPALLCNLRVAKDPWVQQLLRYRKMTKVLTTYLRKFPVVAHEGRIYGRFNQTGTVTGRLSSSEPNLQNLPAHGELGPRVRDLFRGDLIVGDYSQLEPRLMAHFSQDPELLRVYREGLDIYNHVGEAIFGYPVEKGMVERDISKTDVLAMGYGAGPVKLAQIQTINGYPMDTDTARGHLAEMQRFLRTFFQWREAVIMRAKRDGYVKTIGGAHRRLSAQFKQTTWKARGYGERQAVNAIVQGSAGDIVRRTMCRWPVYVEHQLHYALTLLAQVHDELVWEHEVPEDDMALVLAQLKVAAEEGHGYKLSVPLVFEPNVGHSWYEAKEGTTLVLPENFAGDFEDADAELEEAS